MEELKKRMNSHSSENLRGTAVISPNDRFGEANTGNAMCIEYITGDLLPGEEPWIAPLETILGSYLAP